MTNWLDIKVRDNSQIQRQSNQERNGQQLLLETTFRRTFWSKLLAEIEKEASKFDSIFGSYVLSAQVLSPDCREVVTQFTRATRDVVEVSYHPARHSIEWGIRNGGLMGTYLLKLVADTHVTAVSADRTLTPEDLAKEIVAFIVS